MGAIMLKYVQLLCVAFFMKNSSCSAIKLKAQGEPNLKVAACIAECLSLNSNSIDDCYKECSSSTETLMNIKLSYVPKEEDSEFNLYCRDSEKLVIKIDHDFKEEETYIYMLEVQESTGKFSDTLVYLSDENLIEVGVDALTTNELSTLSYNISAYIVSSSAIQTLGMKKITSLMEKYKPQNITEISVVEWIPINDEFDDPYLNLRIKWQPANDRTCSYDVIYFGFFGDESDQEIRQSEVENRNLYEFTITEKLHYNEEYQVGIRGKNTKHPYLESVNIWKKFKAPSPDAALNYVEKLKVKNLTIVEVQLVSKDHFNVNVNWTTNIPADYFNISIHDADENIHNKTNDVMSLNGNISSYIFENILLQGSTFSVRLKAYRNDENDTTTEFGFVPLYEENHIDDILFYSLVAFMCLLLIALFKVWKGRIDSFISILAQKRLEHMDLETVKTISTGTILDSIAELTKDTSLEIEMENITMLESLGEGAFGLVKKALMIRNGEKKYVAVKMLKNTSNLNLEDIKQFHQEITVMKSVGQHSNIVSIVGHCTADLKYLMLITEYCDSGNLLDILRQEFAKQLNFYDKKHNRRISQQKYPDSLLNFDMTDGDKKEISYKNIVGCSNAARLFVVNQMYDDLNNNSDTNGKVLKAIEMTATNALYLELNDDDGATTTIEIPERSDDFIDFLTSSDLISFAKQIADGMDFLSRKKVVHRDLAARNILLCSDKTVKISDFGLSRDIYQDNVYQKTGNGKLPIKWLALESMTHQVYTSQSDVWSFGILLYEIITLGAQPYSSIAVENLLKVLKSGYRIERPSHCHILLYELMMLCWHANPSDRPSFDILSGKLQHFLSIENSWGERIIDLQRMFDRCTSEMNYMKPLT